MNQDFNLSKIPFHRPLKLDDEEKSLIFNKIDDCLVSGQVTNNHNVRELENNIKEYYGVKHAIATSCATLGLQIALQAISKKEGYLPSFHVNSLLLTSYKDVITPAFAWYSSGYAIASANFNPWYQDITLNTWNLDISTEYESDQIILPVHTFGNVCEIKEAINIIYDGAHSLGSKIKDFGSATVLSLAPTKIITSIEGGIILTDDTELATYIVNIRDKVSRMSEIHAIFGNTFLSHIDKVMKFKKTVYNYYQSHLKGQFQEVDQSTNYNTIGLLTDLKMPDTIETKKYYEPLMSGFKNTDEVYKRIICLPSYYDVDYKEVVRRILEVNK